MEDGFPGPAGSTGVKRLPGFYGVQIQAAVGLRKTLGVSRSLASLPGRRDSRRSFLAAATTWGGRSRVLALSGGVRAPPAAHGEARPPRSQPNLLDYGSGDLGRERAGPFKTEGPGHVRGARARRGEGSPLPRLPARPKPNPGE